MNSETTSRVLSEALREERESAPVITLGLVLVLMAAPLLIALAFAVGGPNRFIVLVAAITAFAGTWISLVGLHRLLSSFDRIAAKVAP